ncbi:enoyl-CoA hydratase [Citricoccus zhacaiensis]|uniref:Enoyl-CoA hydratase n=1 Tax=Citricoccus zhacaiensis TaxID=489142 RepID=A0ABQ2LW45_9MICC|nr:enoyl-CoA hydratase/isomerase family protein [Citricoccus zhacaiensis]GGO43785.1 enoyl-CoA hydratase [Citricoccus zhacaiensis]
MTETTASGGSVEVSQSGSIATLTLSNSGRRNTMTEAMWRALEPACARLADDASVRAVVVRGAGTDFSAGADISDLRAILRDEDSGHHDGGAVAAGEAALAGLHKPTIAAVEGYCLGGAWQIAAACDIRLASSGATFGITPAKIGIVYPTAGIERLVRIAGPATAKYLLFSGDFVDAERARVLGLVQAVHPAETFWDEVDAFVQRLAARSQLSIQAMKDIVDTIDAAGAGDDSGAELRDASDHWQHLMATAGDAEAGVGAFLAKRTPEFTWNGGRDTQRRTRTGEPAS